MVSVEQEEKVNEIQEEEQHKRKEKLWKTIGIIFTIFAIIILIVWASNTKNFKLFPFLFSILAVIFIFVGLFWGVGWWRKYQELKEGKFLEGKLPPAITLEMAAELIDAQLKNPRYADYVTGWKNHKFYNAGKDGKTQVLLVHLDTIYSSAQFQFIVMNLHDPKNKWCYICQEKYNPSELTKAINSVAYSPDTEPDTRVIEEESPMTGVKRKVTETHKEKEKEEVKKEGDLE